MAILDKIRFVLIGTTHPGNIGGAARAMKTMSLSKLHLVTPKNFPNAEATARASGADDVLEEAVVHNSLKSAIADCHKIYGMSARLRHLPLHVVNPRDAALQIKQLDDETNIAIIFGSEHSGLSNNELDNCQYLINIPTNTDYSSLNLAAAVQICAYELKMIFDSITDVNNISETTDALNADDMEYLFDHFQQSLTSIGFLNPNNPKKLMRRLRRLFNRADLDRNELQILHGILRAADINGGRNNENKS
ncbi:MAG: RNA methyltransferase [Piscirickettsiaceae bacterium]|nr:RNA methyltransferase [Piscirickettsiaceae bacterium]